MDTSPPEKEEPGARTEDSHFQSARVPSAMLVPSVSAAAATALLLNLHYPLLGRPFLEGPLTSRPVLSLGNKLFAAATQYNMQRNGVPMPTKTEVYASGPKLEIDVYEPDGAGQDATSEEPRMAILYFHSGAFIAGHRSMGAGVCGLMASHGAVCLSASYRLTNSGAGVAGCIEDAWKAYRWVQAHAVELNVDPSRIVVAGDSAGGLLATALGTGLGGDVPTGMGGFAPIDRSMLPAAVIGNWPCTTLDYAAYVPRRGPDGASWEETPAGTDFAVANAFVPEEHRHSQEATHTRLRTVLAGGLLAFGRRWKGLLPAPECYPSDRGASVSPLRRASRRSDLPPMLLLSGGDDQIVPCTQTERFCDVARGAGNSVTNLIFEGAVHGGGAINCDRGRVAVIDFLRHHDLLRHGPSTASPNFDSDPRNAIAGTLRAFSIESEEYEYAEGGRYLPAEHGSATLRLRPTRGSVSDDPSPQTPFHLRHAGLGAAAAQSQGEEGEEGEEEVRGVVVSAKAAEQPVE